MMNLKNKQTFSRINVQVHAGIHDDYPPNRPEVHAGIHNPRAYCDHSC